MTDSHDNLGSPDDRIERLMTQISEVTQPLGLYLKGLRISSTAANAEEALNQPNRLWITAEFDLGELAFSDRVQHPQRYKENNDTRLVLADAGLDDEANLIAQQWLDRIGPEGGDHDDESEPGQGTGPEEAGPDGG